MDRTKWEKSFVAFTIDCNSSIPGTWGSHSSTADGRNETVIHIQAGGHSCVIEGRVQPKLFLLVDERCLLMFVTQDSRRSSYLQRRPTIVHFQGCSFDCIMTPKIRNDIQILQRWTGRGGVQMFPPISSSSGPPMNPAFQVGLETTTAISSKSPGSCL
jgi:hypothetical protein